MQTSIPSSHRNQRRIAYTWNAFQQLQQMQVANLKGDSACGDMRMPISELQQIPSIRTLDICQASVQLRLSDLSDLNVPHLA